MPLVEHVPDHRDYELLLLDEAPRLYLFNSCQRATSALTSSGIALLTTQYQVERGVKIQNPQPGASTR